MRDPDVPSAVRPAPELTIVIPTFNERANVPLIAERVQSALTSVSWEIIFVDDNSPDGTAFAAKELGARDQRIRCIRRIDRRGLAGACIEGALASQAEYVAVMDADLQHDENLLAGMLSRLRANEADLVIGSRYLDQSEIDGFPRKRRLLSQIAGSIAARALGIRVADPMSGFYMTRRSVFEEIASSLSTQGFKILLDILVSAPQGLRVLELPYRFRARQHGSSKLDAHVALDYVGLVVAKISHNLIPVRFVSFGLVGTSGILVHLIALKGALSFGTSFPVAQAVATLVSMTSNFFLNNLFTYRDQRLTGLSVVRGLATFYAICAVGAVSNVGVASWLYSNRPIWWLDGLLGSMVSAIWNFALSSRFVWRR